MRDDFLRHLFLQFISLCLLIVCAGAARAQQPPIEIRMRDGSVIKATPSMVSGSDYVELRDGPNIERSNVSAICFSECTGAPRRVFRKDLVVLNDGRRKLGYISAIGPVIDGKIDSNTTVTLETVGRSSISDRERFPFSEIKYVAFADDVFYSLAQAFRTPKRVRRVIVASYSGKHLPSKLATLTNLEALEIQCVDNLTDLPSSIGSLSHLQELILDNGGRACSAGISIPESIGQLANLKVLKLYAVLSDSRASKGLQSIANLTNLEELDLGGNRLRTVPRQIASLHNLKRLLLDYCGIRQVPDFVGNLTSLREFSLISNKGVVLPESLRSMKGLKVSMGDNSLKLKDQSNLRRRFPDIVFDFENDEYVQPDEENEGPPARKPGAKTKRLKRGVK